MVTPYFRQWRSVFILAQTQQIHLQVLHYKLPCLVCNSLDDLGPPTERMLYLGNNNKYKGNKTIITSDIKFVSFDLLAYKSEHIYCCSHQSTQSSLLTQNDYHEETSLIRIKANNHLRLCRLNSVVVAQH
uniref:Uncharacterized protein n=1 Tax=Glossina austeni TaxID=7395 RepID=A0A1A9V345_GLOAU